MKQLDTRIVASLGRGALSDLEAAGEADILELRLDLMEGDPLPILKAVKKVARVPIIATARWQAEGGEFKGGEGERLELLIRAATFADYIDVELRCGLLGTLLKRAELPVIVSYHDFSRTPPLGELRAILAEMKNTGAQIAKIAVTPHSLQDNLEVLQLLQEADMPLCAIAMGSLGRHLRAVAPLYGSVLTYGYVSAPTAPGQMSVSQLRQALELLAGE
jgi:3-dehydroquinate dehydratase-1